ncbi:flagellar type III secretion system pore protein FliP [Citrobacter portucalensis]|uniref:flagellar type III secretion system pore protein FliP n=1 Tax=Citrobacter portucalensis TaxID=1639133 RepID=UPI00226B54DD|nr:flagellar type III secretion system pore protein FliP [Citrobacter portucalensis]MCX8985947.1 EscR/YscR/HrcR family type III secretion system export apparatus protein [Citrobacter portucalensis]
MLNPDNAYAGVNVAILLVLIILSAVFFICFSGFVKYSIVLNIIKNAVGTQQIPPSMVVNLLAALMALNSFWPVLKPGLETIKPYFSASQPQFSRRNDIIDEQKKTITMYDLVSNLSEFFPEVLEQAKRKTTKLTQLVELPLNFDADSDLFKFLIGSLILDLYQGFELGLKLYMIFVSIDFLIAVILSGVGMTMLSPTVISTPVKLAIFYFSDSWTVLFRALE